MKLVWDRATMRFTEARYIPRQHVIDVTFENGDHFIIAVESLLPGPAMTAEWSQLRIGETGDVIEVPQADRVVEIPWDRVRAVADPQFRAHLTDRAGERARLIGARIRALRVGAGLSEAELAEKAGVERETLTSVEAGRTQPSVDLIEHIALALGKRLRDFAVPEKRPSYQKHR